MVHLSANACLLQLASESSEAANAEYAAAKQRMLNAEKIAIRLRAFSFGLLWNDLVLRARHIVREAFQSLVSGESR